MKPNERCGTTHQRHSRSPRLEPWGVVTKSVPVVRPRSLRSANSQSQWRSTVRLFVLVRHWLRALGSESGSAGDALPAILEIAAACSMASRLIPAADEFSMCHGVESRPVPFSSAAMLPELLPPPWRGLAACSPHMYRPIDGNQEDPLLPTLPCEVGWTPPLQSAPETSSPN